ncbi:AcrR family transcriptional regulator [Chryseobacterium sp. 52]|uniref:TetR/AcrR family transcriptional regulator n=1 Tax=Chryseobacterium sp. 52 TaxID=2035213 RepID=UPI000C1A3A7F|nr:TetR/AcrR family transcriptional regulator [Chryseobacterium sp. 52]PIF46744.1 AcrR family transcriptional regulator [Chryseobacterium sp. 52]
MDTKNRIIETADTLFYDQGYQTTGINQIISEAKVAKGTLYNHFKSKSELGQAYVERSSNQWFSGLMEELEKFSTPKDKLLAVFSFLDKHTKKNYFNGCRIINIMTEIAGEDEQITIMSVAHKQKFRDFLYTLASEISTKPITAQEIADTIYLLYEGATVESKIFKQSWPIELARKNAERILIQDYSNQ